MVFDAFSTRKTIHRRVFAPQRRHLIPTSHRHLEVEPSSSSCTQLEPMNRGGSNKSHFLSLANDLILPPDCSSNLQVISFASNNSLFLIVWNERM